MTSLQLSRFRGPRTRGALVAAMCGVAVPLFVACSSDEPGSPPPVTRTLEDGAVVTDDGAVVTQPAEDGGVVVPADDAAAVDGGPKPPGDAQVPPVSGTGRILYRYAGYKLIEARAGAAPFDVGSKLATVSPGSDSRMNMGADGSFVSETTRFGCSTPCLAIFSPTLSSGEKVLPGGAAVRDMRGVTPAVAGGGTIIVHGGRGTHNTDLYVTRKAGGAWSASTLLTAASTFANNFKPQISPDGLKVVFDCGSDPYGSSGTSICEVNLDAGATGFRKVIGPEGGPGGGRNTHSPSYDRDGSIVFEGEWTREQVWRIRGTGAPTRVNGTYGNDNTPCLLPNGKVASLWLDRSGNPSGVHELKLMNGDGSGMVMLVTGVDIIDTGLGCGN
ncbi:MAG: hypothetical protein IPQ09_22355 [Myxococcales bacterium]|nr:hypothetical protein [Myxococcales bacterium]HQY62661.1 hypothetical protein [Polyangiaceae bacterium]